MGKGRKEKILRSEQSFKLETRTGHDFEDRLVRLITGEWLDGGKAPRGGDNLEISHNNGKRGRE